MGKGDTDITYGQDFWISGFLQSSRGFKGTSVKIGAALPGPLGSSAPVRFKLDWEMKVRRLGMFTLR